LVFTLFSSDLVYSVFQCDGFVLRNNSFFIEPLPNYGALGPLLQKRQVSAAELDKMNLGAVLEADKIPERYRLMAKLDKGRRVAEDAHVEYGDGGSSVLCFPIYELQNVLEKKEREEFFQALEELNAERNDVQSEVVRDIIDPNLFPYLRTESWDWRGEKLEKQLALWKKQHPNTKFRPIEEIEYEGLEKDELEEMLWDLEAPHKLQLEIVCEDKLDLSPLPPRILMRSTYNWVPSLVHVANGVARFVESINDLPRTPKTERIYRGMEQTFEKMIPMLQQLRLIGIDGKAQLQVVAKAQQYVLQPGMTYKGFWHREGMLENIVAVGVYYVDVEEGIVGGSVKFRSPGEVPDPHYAEYVEPKPELSVRATHNSCMVFANSVPHRVRMMRNRSSSVQKRTFVNFFIVDPKQPLKTTPNFLTQVELQVILQRYVKSIGHILPGDICKLILARTGLWESLDHAKKFRAEARKAMQSTSTGGAGFYHYHYGNCGVQRFSSAIEMEEYNIREECSDLYHTSSANESSEK
jgi:hypothetical protein